MRRAVVIEDSENKAYVAEQRETAEKARSFVTTRDMYAELVVSEVIALLLEFVADNANVRLLK